jgi:hypothetical protein
MELECKHSYKLGYGLDEWGLIPDRARKEIFPSLLHPHGLWGPSNFLHNGYLEHLSLELKQLTCEADLTSM